MNRLIPAVMALSFGLLPSYSSEPAKEVKYVRPAGILMSVNPEDIPIAKSPETHSVKRDYDSFDDFVADVDSPLEWTVWRDAQPYKVNVRKGIASAKDFFEDLEGDCAEHLESSIAATIDNGYSPTALALYGPQGSHGVHIYRDENGWGASGLLAPKKQYETFDELLDAAIAETGLEFSSYHIFDVSKSIPAFRTQPHILPFGLTSDVKPIL